MLGLEQYSTYTIPDYAEIAVHLIDAIRSGQRLEEMLSGLARMSCGPCQLGDAVPLVQGLLEHAGECCVTPEGQENMVKILKNLIADQPGVATYLAANIGVLVQRATLVEGLLEDCTRLCLALVIQNQDVGQEVWNLFAANRAAKETARAQKRFGGRRLKEYARIQSLILQCLERSSIFPVPRAEEIFCQSQIDCDHSFLDALRAYQTVDPCIVRRCMVHLRGFKTGHLCLLRLIVEDMHSEGSLDGSFSIGAAARFFGHFLTQYGDIFLVRVAYEGLWFCFQLTGAPEMGLILQENANKIPLEYRDPQAFL